MEYKRLTNEELNDFTSRVVVQLEPALTQQVMSLILELNEYRTKIENGTLIELPCKVGDTVYCVYRDDEYEYWIEPEEVVDFIITDYGIDIGTACRMIGKVYREEVFLTKDQAEQRLKEIKQV